MQSLSMHHIVSRLKTIGHARGYRPHDKAAAIKTNEAQTNPVSKPSDTLERRISGGVSSTPSSMPPPPLSFRGQPPQCSQPDNTIAGLSQPADGNFSERSRQLPPDEQKHLLAKTKKAIIEQTVSDKDIDDLNAVQFDDERLCSHSLMRSLCYIALDRNIEAIEELNKYLRLRPSDRAGTVYRAIARWRDDLATDGPE